ncbi:MAG: tetratricopeptide repeat protein [Gammaproteobacteria bacterium]|nr:tetratricopeptide repeat protein [Gammaproteobacteria bacterium]MYF62656.1 tetratricopeptide repeat protein [Gammaproteobacteria bacterium]MYI23348.1 tetratricopeptide repeat protein [Gammaproteobacteria bacterium]
MFFRLAFPRLGVALLAAFLFLPALASAQQEVQGRFRVMIPDLFPGEDTGRGFGEDVAEELRDLINQLPTHEPVERNEIRDAMRQFDIDRDDLNCIRSRQLATQINAELVMCANYTEGRDDWTITDIQFVSVASGETFTVDDFTIPDDDGDELAAQHIFGVFDGYVEQLRFAAICQEYFGSQQWANALQNCDRAIEGNPNSEGSRYARARAVMELGDRREGLDEMMRVLDLNPFNENALQFAGMLSAEFGMDEESLRHYTAYLELNPGSAAVRMRVAYDLATAGNAEGAMVLIEEGIAMDDANDDLWEQLGGFAFTAAGQAMEGQSEPTPEVERLYRRAIEAYSRVLDARGAEMTPAQLGNVINAYVQLGDPAAIDFAQRAVQVHPQEAALWSRLADALQRNDRLEEAIEALESVREVNPDYQNLSARQGSWLLEADEVDEAIGFLKEAVERGEQSPDMMANLLFGKAYNDGVQVQQFTFAANLLETAKSEFEVSERMASQLNFWHGWSLYNHGLSVQEPNTIDSARQSLPIFQQALQLFELGRAYAATVDSINLTEILGAAQTYVDIQDAIIRRGGGE